MNFKLHHVVILSLSLVCLPAAQSYAKAPKKLNRNDIIEKKLSCFSQHGADQQINWEEVCVTSTSHHDPSFGDDMDDKSLDQMVKEHEALADDMVSNSVIGEKISDKTVDDVVEKVNNDEDTKRTVDDVIKEQNISNDFVPSSADSDSSTKLHQKTDYQLAKNDSTNNEGNIENTDNSSQVAPVQSNSNSFERDTVNHSNTFEVGFEYNRFRYVEPVFDLVDKGNLFGIYGSYTARPAKHENLYEDIIDVYRIEGRFNYGKVDYKSNGSGTLADIPDWTYEIRLLGGKDFLLGDSFRITPLIGFGFRYLNDDAGGMQASSGSYGYEREAHYFYIPLGLEMTTRIADHWTITPSIEYDIFIQGTQDSHLSDVPGGFPDLRNKQHQGYGVRGSIKLVKEMNPFSLVVEPYIRYWDIQDSDTATVAGSSFLVTGLEPANNSTEYGIRLGAIF